jgi:hypothetical protein
MISCVLHSDHSPPHTERRPLCPGPLPSTSPTPSASAAPSSAVRISHLSPQPSAASYPPSLLHPRPAHCAPPRRRRRLDAHATTSSSTTRPLRGVFPPAASIRFLYHQDHAELPRHLGVRPVAGLLLHGPPGCGKTTLAHAIDNETGVPFYKISAPDIMHGVPGTFSDFASRFGKLLTVCIYLGEHDFN